MEIAALIVWVVTALGGGFLLGKWIAGGGPTAPHASRFPPALIFGHFALAAIGLLVWIAYLVVDSHVLAWIAFGLLVVVALLGATMFARWLPARRATAGAGGAPAAEPPERGFPVPVVALHGLLAVATVVLVILTALEVGES